MPKGIYTRKAKVTEIKTPKSKPKLIDMEQLDGKVYSNLPRTLDEIMGVQETNKYKYHSSEEYEDFLRGLNNTDLWNEASRCGLGRTHDSVRLRRSLLEQYNRYYRERPVQGRQSSNTPIVSDAVKKILSEGR